MKHPTNLILTPIEMQHKIMAEINESYTREERLKDVLIDTLSFLTSMQDGHKYQHGMKEAIAGGLPRFSHIDNLKQGRTMDGFTKLFSSIITSSIWSEDDKVRIMWITMLASADAAGNVIGSIPEMAAIARMDLREAERSILSLCSPDQYSRSQEYEGRRLIEVDGGWLIVNYLKYRQRRDPEKRKEQNRIAQAKFKGKPKVSRGKPQSAQAEADNKRKLALVYTDEFNSFWSIYPKKVGKGDAYKSWCKIRPNAELQVKMIAAVEIQKKSDQWLKENGQYIPNPATWLNQGRWEDELNNTGSEKRTRLFPISGKVCGVRGCKFPAVYKSMGDFDHYYCHNHMPEEVKEKYYA